MSSSILTNASAITAVQNLAATQKALGQVQNEISTGLAVSSAQDNAAYFSIAQTLRTSVSNLSAVSSSLNLGSSVVNTATAATNNVYSVLQTIQKDLVSASQSGNDLSSLQSGIDTLRQQLGTTIDTASFNGVNLLNGSNTTGVSFVSGVSGSGANTVVNQLQVDTSQTNLSGATYVTGSNALAKAATTADATAATYNNALNALNSALGAIPGGVSLTTLAATSTAIGASGTETNLAYIFGSSAAFGTGANAHTITGIDANSIAGQLLGGGGSLKITDEPSVSNKGAITAGGSLASTTANDGASKILGDAVSTFNTAVAALKTSDYTGTSSALTAIFGSGASVATVGSNYVVTVSSTETAVSDSGVALLGKGGTYTIPTGSVSGSATTTADGTFAAGTSGALNKYNTAQNNFNSAINALGIGGVTKDNYESVFGVGSTFNASTGAVSSIQKGSIGAALLGTTGSTYTSTSLATASSTDKDGAFASFFGVGATSTTTGATAAAGTLANAQYNADQAALADPAAKSAYLVDTAAAATNSNSAAKSAYTAAKTTFTTAVAGLTQTDFTTNSAAFQTVFGANASYSTSTGTVTGLGQTSAAGTLLGTSGAYKVSDGSYSTSGTDAASGGALFTLYGSGGTSKTTDATATGGTAKVASDAVKAVNGDTAASATFNGALFSISQINLAGASASQIANYTQQVGAALKALNNTQVVLGAAASNIDLQSTYTSTLSSSLTTGVGSLVDADLNEASTRLNALQTQQQLGVQALSVANQNSQLILKLFQG